MPTYLIVIGTPSWCAQILMGESKTVPHRRIVDDSMGISIIIHRPKPLKQDMTSQACVSPANSKPHQYSWLHWSNVRKVKFIAQRSNTNICQTLNLGSLDQQWSVHTIQPQAYNTHTHIVHIYTQYRSTYTHTNMYPYIYSMYSYIHDLHIMFTCACTNPCRQSCVHILMRSYILYVCKKTIKHICIQTLMCTKTHKQYTIQWKIFKAESFQGHLSMIDFVN